MGDDELIAELEIVIQPMPKVALIKLKGPNVKQHYVDGVNAALNRQPLSAESEDLFRAIMAKVVESMDP